MTGPAALSPQQFFQLVGDPKRWRLLRELARSDRRVSELTALVDEPQNLVSYHLGELRNAGLVSSRRSSFDGRDAYYRIEPSRLADLLGEAADALQPGLVVTALNPQLSRLSRRAGRRPRVLFLCTGNSARSQMAEALLEHRSHRTMEARSAGSHPKSLHPNAVRVMAERGIDISGRSTKHLDRFARTRFDSVITLCDRVREVCPEFPGEPQTAHWSMADPAAEGGTDEASYPAFERIANELEVRIRHLIIQLSSTKGGTAHVA